MRLVNLSQSIKRTRLHEQVAKILCLKIFQKELFPEALLPNEDALAEQLGVSKPVIREAISFMESKGLVEVRPRVGTRVTDPSNWTITDPTLMSWLIESDSANQFIEEIVELRLLIEPIAAGLAAQRASVSEIDRIEHAFQMMQSANTVAEHIHADLNFHMSIIKASGNSLLVSSLKPILENTLSSSFRHFIHSIDAARESLPVHQAVLTAIKNRNQEEAISATKKIIGRYSEDIEKTRNNISNTE